VIMGITIPKNIIDFIMEPPLTFFRYTARVSPKKVVRGKCIIIQSKL